MRKVIYTLFFSVSVLLMSCDMLNQVVKDSGILDAGMISNQEAVTGLKQALELGTSSGTMRLGGVDGFLKNAAYKILLPPEIQNVVNKIRGNALANALAGSYLDKVEESMNRGAERAMAEAKPIFIQAIRSMTITDAVNIVTGRDGGATDFLKRATTAQLTRTFSPVISKSLDAVNIRSPWEKVSRAYNMVTGKSVSTDLTQYVTDKAMTALFSEIRKEEDKIRHNPIARTTDILKKVFAYADANRGLK